MFTDMVGYSALTQRDEPLALKHVEEQHRLLKSVFDRFGGREVKTMGDGMLVEYDSALDATECAVAMQRRFFERNRDTTGERIEIRVGIHVGDVVHSGSDVYGDAVNIASRIEPLAEPGGVCVSGPVHEQVQNKIPYPLRPLERAFLKNIQTPVSVYRLELPWTPPSLSEATPFTDRKEELDRLRAARANVGEGEGVAVAIAGESGVGKSRLIDEFVAGAEKDGARVLRGRGDPAGASVPFAPWSEAVRDFAREAPNPLLYKVCADCAAEVTQLVPELRGRLGPGAEAAPAPESSQVRLFDGILRFLENMGREAPVVVVLDDLQWADAASLHLLDYVARRLHGRRVLVIGAYQEEPARDRGRLEPLLERLVRERRLEVIPLRRLDPATSLQMVRGMLKGRLPTSGGPLASLLVEKSGGNPMVLEAIVRSLVRDGSLVWTEEGWTPKVGVDIRLPPGVQSVIRQRLAELDQPTVDLLRQASVLGSQFTFDALQRLSGVGADELLGRLEGAIGDRILEERPSGSGRSTYAFTDRLLQETLYEEISLVRRARYHANAARVLEALAAEGVPTPAAELAHHFVRASDFDKALDYTLRAAEEAVRLHAREEALHQYELAQELLEARPDPKRRAEVLFRLGEQYDLLGRHTEGYRAMREAAETYEQLGLNVEAGVAHRGIARRISAHNEPVRAMEHLEKARRLLEAEAPGIELARLYDAIGVLMFQEVRLREAAENWSRAIEIAGKVGAPTVEASARMMLASVVPPGESARVWEHLEVVLGLATRTEARAVVPNVLMLKAIALLQIRGDARAALRAAEDAIEYARRGKDVRFEMAVKGGLLTYIEWRIGDLGRAERTALEHRTFAAGDPRRERSTAIVVLAEVALARGEVDRAEQLLWEAERLLSEGGDWTDRAHTHIVLGRCALRRGRPTSAVEHLRTANELSRKAGPPAMDALFLLEGLGLLVRAHLDAGNAEGAEASLRELADLARTSGEELGRAYGARAEGWVRSHRGDLPGAIAALEESNALWRRLGWQYEWAQTQLGLAGVLGPAGQTARAAELSEQASEFLSKVGVRAEDRPG